MPVSRPAFGERRWYDQQPSCRRLLQQIHAMPQPEIRQFCARVLIHFCERLRKGAAEGMNSIGAEAVSSLYKFGNQKRRWYDKDTVTQKAAGMFYTLSPEQLGLLGFKLGDTFGLLQIYSTVCEEVEQIPEDRDMARICTAALQAGRKEAEDVLISIIGKDLYDSLSASTDVMTESTPLADY